LIFVLLANSISRADNRPGGEVTEHPIKEELMAYNGLTIDSIEIDNRKIFDTEADGYNNLIYRTANKLHVKTQKTTIARELLLKNKGAFDAELAEESVRNLRNRYVIFDAWNEVYLLTDSTILWRVVTIDEWSFAGGFEFSREGNEYRYTIGFEEKNLLGLNQLLSLDYTIQEKDDDYLASSFRDFRFFGNPFSVFVNYKGDPKSEIEQLTISRPFYSLSQKYSYGINFALASSRNEIYSNSFLIGTSQSESDILGTFLSYRLGQRQRNVVPSLTYNYKFSRTGDKTIYSLDPADSNLALASFPIDSSYHQIELGFRIFKVHFTTFRKIDGFGYTEDFTLGHTAAIALARAFNPGFDDHVYDRLYLDYSFGHSFGKELFYFSYIRANKFKGGRDFQRVSSWLANYYHHGPEYFTIAFRAKYVHDWRREGTESLILGGSSGLRGYPSEFKTGDKLAIAGLEGRFNPNIRLFSAVFGLAVFADAGRTWKRDENFSLDDYVFSGGLGLRFAIDRSSKSRFFRIDLAYSEETSWQLSLSTGQYFSYGEHRLFLTSR